MIKTLNKKLKRKLMRLLPRSYVMKKRRELMIEMYYNLRNDSELKMSKSEAIHQLMKYLASISLRYENVESYILFKTEEERLS